MPILILGLAFVISGAAGLIYESTWTRYLSLFVGHDAYAQALVLVIFLGGMSVGAWLGGRWSARARSPLLGYALVESAAGGIGLVFHPLFVALTGWAYLHFLPPLADGIWLGPAKWALCAFLLLPQSILLGASFPLMVAGVLRIAPELPGRRLAQFYFANSLGAAVGVLLGGFVLVPWGGLPGAIRIAAAANLLVAMLVVAVALWKKGSAAPVPAPIAPVPAPSTRGRTRTLLLAVSAGTAIASLLYEIDWIRMLSLVLGSATHSFELMLSAFILGLALGSYWISGRADGLRRPFSALGAIQVAMGVCALGTLFAYTHAFGWMSWLLHALTKTEAGYQGFTIARYLLAGVIMLPATCFAGMTLPLITRLLLARGGSSSEIGAVYAWNTFGSIIGVIIGSLLLLPLLGVKWLLIAAGATDILLGVALLAADQGEGLGRPSQRTLLVGVTALLVAALITGGAVRLDPLVLASGVYRTGELLTSASHEVLYYSDGRTASVAALRAPSTSVVSINTNGKPDASVNEMHWRMACPGSIGPAPLDGDASTQVLLPLITLAYRGEARTAAVVGFGSGMSTQMLLGAPGLASVTTLEIEPKVLEAARTLYPINARAYDDPRSHLVFTDARTHLATSGVQYDLIMSEPSNPWVSGVSGLFTSEFYARVKGALAPRGVFGQWLHAYELDDDLILSVLSAIHQTFGDYVVYQVGEGDYLVVATSGTALPSPDWRVFDASGLADLRCRTFTPTAETMRTLRVGGRALFAPLLANGIAPNSDFHPILDLGAERRRFLDSRANGLEAISGDWRGLAGALEGIEPLDPDTVPSPPYVAIHLLRGRSAASVLARVSGGAGGRTMNTPEAASLQDQWNAWTFRLTGPAPSSWPNFLSALDALSLQAHRGTAGYANEALFSSARAFLVRHQAPSSVRLALEFRHALQIWDLQGMALAGTALLPSIKEGEGLVDRELYIDAMLVAAVQLRRPGVAGSVVRVLGPARPEHSGDMRDALLRAHLSLIPSTPMS